MALLAAVALPRLGSRLGRDGTDTAVNWLVLNMGKFKSMALDSDLPLSLCYDPEANGFRFSSTAGEAVALPSGHRALFHTLAPGVRVEGIAVQGRDPEKTANCFRFYPRGYSDPARIFIANDQGRELTLVVHPFLYTVTVHEGRLPFP